jgi:hypothetical protein
MTLKTFVKRFYLDEEHPDAFIELPVRPGKHTITMDRTEADVLHAKRGNSLACMNAECFKREAAEGRFPHPVYGVVFDTCMVYVIDKVTAGRQWKSAVRYSHNDRNGIKIHDKISPAQIIKLGKARKTVVLSPPQKRDTRAGLRGPNDGRAVVAQTTHKLVIPTGTRRRAREAGLFIPRAIS